MALKINIGIEEYEPWAGAVYTWQDIVKENKVEALDYLLDEIYPEGIDEMTLNDILWFDDQWVYRELGMNDYVEDEEEEEEEDEENWDYMEDYFNE